MTITASPESAVPVAAAGTVDVLPPPPKLVSLAGELRHRPFLRLWLAALVSEVGDWAARLALATVVYHRTGSAAWAALIVSSSLLPTLGPGQLLATLADRFDRRIVMVAADLARAAVFLTIAAATALPVWIVVILTIVAGLATVPFEAARSAATLDVTPTERVAAVLSLGQMTQSVALVLGWALGGVLLAAITATGALKVNAVTFAVSAVLLVGLPPLRSAAPADGETTAPPLAAFARLRLAAGFIWADPLVRRAATIAIVAVGPATAVEALVIPAVATHWPSHPSLAAAVLATGAATELLLTLALPLTATADRLVRVASWCAVAPAVLAGVLLVLPQPDLQTAGFVIAAASMAALAPASAALGPRLPAAHRASSFAVLATTLTATQVTLTTAGGFIADWTTPATAAVLLISLSVGAGIIVAVKPLPGPPSRTRRSERR